MKPYASYKPSGVPWLGEVPGHWDGKRLRDCVEGCSNGVWGDEPDGGEDDIPVIRVADFDRDRRRVVEYETVRKVDSSQRGSRGLIPGDMLMEKSGGGEQQPVGMVVSYLVPEDAVCSNFVARMRSREGVVSRFMVYLHAYLYASRVTNISVKQTTGIQNLDSTAYLSEACFVPPPDEQTAIADYLDAETVRIDTLIHEKDELIGLLREWRQSVIAEAVTKGLDKAVATKPSGVPWLGDVPSHWTVEKLKFFVGFAGGGTPTKDNPAYWEGTIPWVSPKDMKRPRISETEDYITEAGQMNSPCTLIPPMSVLTVVRSGILQHSIPVALNMVPVVLNQDMKALLPSERANSRFLAYEISGCQKELREAWVKQGATVESIEHQRMADSELALPPLQEQQAIADYLDTETAKIDDLIAHTNDEITLLKELRAATIADAVLGRIDVRTIPLACRDTP